MYHPTNYVLVTDLDDMEEMEFAELHGKANGASSEPQTAAATGAGAGVAHAAAAQALPMAASAAALAAAKESRKAATQAVSALERLTFQPYYDQRPTSGFTFNTNNTHIPPSAAIEMPERAWQDCIMNTLHVDAVAAAAAAAASTDEEESKQTDSKQLVQQQIQQQQQKQRQKLWNFVDPMQKAPCICTK